MAVQWAAFESSAAIIDGQPKVPYSNAVAGRPLGKPDRKCTEVLTSLVKHLYNRTT